MGAFSFGEARHNGGMKTKGRLIVFEGIDGAGKATQTRLLEKHLRESGRVVTVFDIPRYETAIGKFIEESLHGAHGDFRNASPYLASLPYAIDRAGAAPLIREALKKGDVICNRYTTSNIAFQGAKLSPRDRAAFRAFIESLEYGKLGVPKPDSVILLDVPVGTSARLISGKKKDKHESDLAYQKKVSAEYRSLARSRGWRRIKCDKGGEILPIAEIHEKVLHALE